MTTSGPAAAATTGRRILAETEDTSLEEVIRHMRVQTALALRAREQREGRGGGGGYPRDVYPRDVGVDAGSAFTSSASFAPPVSVSVSVSAVSPSYPLPALQQIVATHFRATRSPSLEIGGAHPLPLLYLLVAAVVSAPSRQAVLVIDLEARFDMDVVRSLLRDEKGGKKERPKYLRHEDDTRAQEHLRHVHVFRVDPRWAAATDTSLAAIVTAAEQRLLYGQHRQRDRPCWGTLVIGGSGLVTSGSASTSLAPPPPTRPPSAPIMARTGFYGWLQVAALPPSFQDPHRRFHKLRQQQQQQQQQLRASPDDGHSHAAHTQQLPGLSDSPEPITWVASSSWGSFSFQLPRSRSRIQQAT